MGKHSKPRRFAYTVDLMDSSGMWGMWNAKEFQNRHEALAYAENLADSNREISVSLNIEPLDRAKWSRKAG